MPAIRELPAGGAAERGLAAGVRLRLLGADQQRRSMAEVAISAANARRDDETPSGSHRD